MKPTVIDWMRESAKYMAIDQPHLYTQESAMAELDTIMEQMRDTQGSGLTSFASFMLIRYQEIEEDGTVASDEWDLVRKISSVSSYSDEEGVWACAYTKNSGTLKYGVDGLPDVLDDEE